MTTSTDLLTIGDSAIDIYMKIDKGSATTELGPGGPEICFYHGTKIPVDSLSTAIAGNACNVAMGTNKLYVKTAIYTELGDDENANRVIKELGEAGIDTTFCLKNKDTLTNVNSVIVYGDDRTIFSHHEKRNYKMHKWSKPKWVFYSSLSVGFENFQQELVAYLRKNPDIGVAFNPGTLQMKAGLESLRNILQVTDILFVNKEEAQKLLNTRETDLKRLHEALNLLGPKMSVITMGKDGSSVFDGTDTIYKPAFSELKIINKTGAGDAYTSAFLAALILKKPLDTAVSWGTINSANLISKGKTLTLQDLQNRKSA